METGLADLVDVLADAARHGAEHYRGHPHDLRRTWPGVNRPRTPQAVASSEGVGDCPGVEDNRAWEANSGEVEDRGIDSG